MIIVIVIIAWIFDFVKRVLKKIWEKFFRQGFVWQAI